jgi:hypothetical protein
MMIGFSINGVTNGFANDPKVIVMFRYNRVLFASFLSKAHQEHHPTHELNHPDLQCRPIHE